MSDKIKAFVEKCKLEPGAWFIYHDSYKGSAGSYHQRFEGMVWTQRRNGDGTNTIYGRYEPF